MITTLIDRGCVTQTSTRGILHTFVEFTQSKYEPIYVDDACVTLMEKAGHEKLTVRMEGLSRHSHH